MRFPSPLIKPAMRRNEWRTIVVVDEARLKLQNRAQQ
jgi:hypothetical protein